MYFSDLRSTTCLFSISGGLNIGDGIYNNEKWSWASRFPMLLLWRPKKTVDSGVQCSIVGGSWKLLGCREKYELCIDGSRTRFRSEMKGSSKGVGRKTPCRCCAFFRRECSVSKSAAIAFVQVPIANPISVGPFVAPLQRIIFVVVSVNCISID